MVSKDELLNAVWPQTFVGDAVLKVTVQQVREALEDDPKSPQFIETAHRRGYRFIGRIGAPDQLAPPESSRQLLLRRISGFQRRGWPAGGVGTIATLAATHDAWRAAGGTYQWRSRYRENRPD